MALFEKIWKDNREESFEIWCSWQVDDGLQTLNQNFLIRSFRDSSTELMAAHKTRKFYIKNSFPFQLQWLRILLKSLEI